MVMPDYLYQKLRQQLIGTDDLTLREFRAKARYLRISGADIPAVLNDMENLGMVRKGGKKIGII